MTARAHPRDTGAARSSDGGESVVLFSMVLIVVLGAAELAFAIALG